MGSFVDEKNEIQRWMGVVAYDGTDFDGWQAQPSGNTVQDCLERALEGILKVKVRIQGSGRTDAGVHARAQVFHFDAVWKHSAEQFMKALHTRLPISIRLNALRPVEADFHARYSAASKCYVYQLAYGMMDPFEARVRWGILNKDYSPEIAEGVARSFKGSHNFAAFAALRQPGQTIDDPVRVVSRFEVKTLGERRYDIMVEANGFLYKMMRSMIGAFVDCCGGRIRVEDIESALTSGQRTHLISTAPPHGLFLDHVTYAND